MRITDGGEMVEFKTASIYFEREKSGEKSNTVRYFKSLDEENEFVSHIHRLLKVCIVEPTTGRSFERMITDITVLPGTIPKVFIISWDPRRDD